MKIGLYIKSIPLLKDLVNVELLSCVECQTCNSCFVQIGFLSTVIVTEI